MAGYSIGRVLVLISVPEILDFGSVLTDVDAHSCSVEEHKLVERVECSCCTDFSRISTHSRKLLAAAWLTSAAKYNTITHNVRCKMQYSNLCNFCKVLQTSNATCHCTLQHHI